MTVRIIGGFGFHQSTPLMTDAGYVEDPLHALLALHGGPQGAPWFYQLRTNPTNYKPPVFQGYPVHHNIIHEPTA